MEKGQLWTIVGVALVVSIATASITGNVIRVDSKKDRIDSTGSLTLSSATGYIKMEGDTTLTKRGQAGGTQFITNNEGSLTIIPKSGYAKLLAQLTLSGDNYQGGVVLKSNEMGSLTITPQSGAAKVEGALSVTNLAGNGTAYACVNSAGKIYRSLTACR